jgi:hypothetical protein
MILRFLYGRTGNVFLRELLQALATAVSEEGIECVVMPGPAPEAGSDVVDVLMPHEYFPMVTQMSDVSRDRLRRTVAVITEHPGTVWFDVACLAATELGASFALNQEAVTALRGRGIPAGHLQLGYVPGWDQWGGGDRERAVDITYMGVSEPRRNPIIAGYGDILWKWRTAILVPPHVAKPTGDADFLVGRGKWRHLASTKVLLNLHRRNVGDTEWPRIMEAICNGAVVVTEHCSDATPLVPGVHYLSASAKHLAAVADSMLHDPEWLDSLRTNAYRFVRQELPMRGPAQKLAETAQNLLRRRRPSRLRLPSLSDATLAQPLMAEAAAQPASNGGQAMLKSRAEERLEIERREQRLELMLKHGPDADSIEAVFVTPSYASARPRISVIVPLYNHEEKVLTALSSLVASDFGDYEVVIMDDASKDGSIDAATAFLAHEPEIAGLVCKTPVNHGPSWTRNRCIERARGELFFFLDSDNGIYPSALGRLAEALDSDLKAALAYPIVAIFAGGNPESLISHVAWRPELLLSGDNPIDMMTMVRQGLEDYDLWCRAADRGFEGRLVPEILGWYRRSNNSVLSVTDIDRTVAMEMIRARSPRLFGSLAS